MNIETTQQMQVNGKTLPLIHTIDLVGFFRNKYTKAEPSLREVQRDLLALGEEMVLFNETITAHIDVTDPAVVYHMRESLVKSMQIVIALLPKRILEPVVQYSNVKDNFINSGLKGDSDYQRLHAAYRIILKDLLGKSISNDMPWMIDGVETSTTGEALNQITKDTLFDPGTIYALSYNMGFHEHGEGKSVAAGFSIHELKFLPNKISATFRKGNVTMPKINSEVIPAIMDVVNKKGEK